MDGLIHHDLRKIKEESNLCIYDLGTLSKVLTDLLSSRYF